MKCILKFDFAGIFLCIYIYICMCMFVIICIHVCLFVNIYIYIYIYICYNIEFFVNMPCFKSFVFVTYRAPRFGLLFSVKNC